MPKIAIYCGANVGADTVYQNETQKLCTLLAQKNWDLVYGGGNVGLMKIAADTFLLNQRKVTGIMPRFLYDREIGHPKLSEFELTETMQERKQRMLALGDAFLALPGGPGTLEEITEALSLARVGQHHKSCLFYNIAGYYDLLAQFFDQMVTTGFLTAHDRQKIHFPKTAVEVLGILSSQGKLKSL